MLFFVVHCLVIVLLLAVHSFAPNAPTLCNGYTDPTTGICYELHVDEQLSWSDAINACQASGSQLAWITNNAENEIIANLLLSLSVTSPVWLAGQLQTLYGQQFYWTWNSDMQPITGQGCYYDNTTTHPLAVPLGQSDLPYTVTSIPSNAMTIDSCKAACLQAGYLFAGVQAGTMCFCGNTYGLYGSVDTSNDNNNCGTVCSGNTAQLCGSNGENFIYQVNGSYSVWSNGRPNNWQGYQTCGILSPSISFKMDDENCGKPSWPFICDIPMASCSNGAQIVNGACYYISPSTSQNAVTWFSARMACLARGGELVKISSPEIWSALVAVIATKTPSSSYWIGMTGLRWYWNNGLEIIYTNWYAPNSDVYEPSTLQNKCLLLDPDSNYQWIDGSCDNLNFYVCMSGKYPPSPTTTTTTTPVPTTVTTTTSTTTTPTTTTPKTTTTTSTTTTPTPTTTTPTTTTTTTTTTTAVQTTTTKTTTTPTTVTTTTTLRPTTTTTSPAVTTTTSASTTPENVVDTSTTTGNAIPTLPDIVLPETTTPTTTDDSGSILPPLEIALIAICCVLAVVFVTLLIVFLANKEKFRINRVRETYGKKDSPEEADLREHGLDDNDGQSENGFRSTDRLQDNMHDHEDRQPHADKPHREISMPPTSVSMPVQ